MHLQRLTAGRTANRTAQLPVIPLPICLRRMIGIIALCTAITVAGCASLFPPLIAEADGRGEMTLTVQSSTFASPGALLHIELTRDNIVLQQQVPFSGMDGSVTIDNLAAGSWNITVQLLDETGVPTHEGDGQVHVNVGTVTHTDIAVAPRPGQLALHIDLGGACIPVQDDECLADVATAGRLHIHPGVKQTTDQHDFPWIPGDTNASLKEIPLPPGSYDFQLTLYKGSRIRSNTRFESFWNAVDIHPGHTTAVTWHPEHGLLDVHVNVQNPPAPPRSLTATIVGAADPDMGTDIALSWESSPGATGYRVYGRRTVREAFTLLDHVPGYTTEWLVREPADTDGTDGPGDPQVNDDRHLNEERDVHANLTGSPEPHLPPCTTDTPARTYVVTAVDHTPYESLRSNEVTVCVPEGERINLAHPDRSTLPAQSAL